MIRHGFRLALISGTTQQTVLYERMGFRPFGPLVGHDGAWYRLARSVMRRPVAFVAVIVPLLLLAGLQGIDPGLYEAARMDGARAWRQFRGRCWSSLSPRF